MFCYYKTQFLAIKLSHLTVSITINCAWEIVSDSGGGGVELAVGRIVGKRCITNSIHNLVYFSAASLKGLVFGWY